MNDSKEYIEHEYKIAMSDYKLAADDESKHRALAAMHKLTTLAALAHGYEFADGLKKITEV